MFELLKNYKDLMREIECMKLKIKNNEAELERWVVGDLAHIKLERESIAADLPKYIERDQELLAVLKIRRDNLLNMIDVFDDLDSQILKLYYIEGKRLYEIAEQLAYSYPYIRSRHSSIVQAINLYDQHLLNYLDEPK